MKHQDWRFNEKQKQLERDVLVKGGKSDVVAIPMNGAENRAWREVVRVGEAV